MNLENKKKELEEKLLKSVVNDLKSDKVFSKVKSIIITGSFGRHEPTYSINDNEISLKSDVEIGIVYDNFLSKKQIQRLINKVKKEYNEDLNLMLISYNRVKKIKNYNTSIISEQKKTLFTYDLYNGSYTIDGERVIENTNVSIDMLDLYEAKRIVANRIAELIYLTRIKKDTSIKLQWQSKLILAIASAWLIMNKLYISSYNEQYNVLNKFEKKVEIELGNDFLTYYNNAFNYLRKSGEEFFVDEKMLVKFVNYINIIFDNNNIKKSKSTPIGRKMKYLIKSIKKYKRVYLHEDEIISNIIVLYINNDINIIKESQRWHDILY